MSMANPAIEMLASAAARGVEVVILTNDHPVPPLRLKWTHEEFWWGAKSRTRAAGFHLVVIDRDGDSSEWVLRRDGVVLAHGETHECRPYYHFDNCMVAGEAALIEHARLRKAGVQRRKESSPCE